MLPEHKLSSENYFGLGPVPVGVGAVLKGWDITTEAFYNPGKLPVVDFRAMTEKCPHDCFHCFTDKNKKTLSLKEIKRVINELAALGTHAIDYLGEGEPTLDKDFMEIISHTRKNGIIPVLFTDAALKLRDRDTVKHLYDLGTTVIPKCDSLFNPEYQNWVVGDKKGIYFEQRKEAIDLLMQERFNKVQSDGTTRLGFDMVVTKGNLAEVAKTLRYCRDRNLWIIFTTFLPSGRSGADNFEGDLVLGKSEINKLREEVSEINDNDYGFKHPIYNNFLNMPCVEFMQIYGDGRVSPCPGNETVIGNVRHHSIAELKEILLSRFPKHCRNTYSGHCLYRPAL